MNAYFRWKCAQCGETHCRVLGVSKPSGNIFSVARATLPLDAPGPTVRVMPSPDQSMTLDVPVDLSCQGRDVLLPANLTAEEGGTLW